MAPALTQATEPQSLAVAKSHSPPSSPSHLGHNWADLKEISSQVAHAVNGDSPSVTLAPPAWGQAEGHPAALSSHCTTMDQSGNLAHQTYSVAPDMGCSTGTAVEAPRPQVGLEVSQKQRLVGHQEGSIMSSQLTGIENSNELLALMGRDFNDVNEIIDTLQELVSNPELINDAARNLDPVSIPLVGSMPTENEKVDREERAAVLIGQLSVYQQHLEKRRMLLLRRLRRVTARGLGATVSAQLRQLLVRARASLSEQRACLPSADVVAAQRTGLTGNVFDTLEADAMKGMSTSALVNLIKRVEVRQNAAQLTGMVASQQPEPCLPESLRTQIDTVAAEVLAAARGHVHHDSDATESSSGGESCDEMDGYGAGNSSYKPISERAFYKYCKIRGWAASRWTWLQAQIADLEYRILQQQKIYMHVRANKGSVQLAEENGVQRLRLNARDPAHLEARDPALTCITTPSSIRTTVNGYHPSKGDDSSSVSFSQGIESLCGCARSIGIRAVKRRRLVRSSSGPRRTAVVHGGGKPPNVPCQCTPPLSCVLCARPHTNNFHYHYHHHNLHGSSGNAAVHNHRSSWYRANTTVDMDQRSLSDRLSRVDPAFHPVLSRHGDMLQSEQYDKVLKNSDWQRKLLTTKTNSTPPLSVMSPRLRESVLPEVKVRRKDRDHRRLRKHKKKEIKGRITLKLKKSLISSEPLKDGEMKKRRLSSASDTGAAAAAGTLKKVRNIDDDEESVAVPTTSRQSSPSVSPAPIDRSISQRRHSNAAQKNKQQSTNTYSYDIDNIVIPYSMAASARVEKLEYKEIPTPKWRCVPLIPNLTDNSQDDEPEDISEETCLARHNRSEELERKKFLQYFHLQGTSRHSRCRRTDSSGTNTPDHPMSPRLPDSAIDNISPMATPPSTPLAASEDSNQSASISIVIPVISLSTSVQNGSVSCSSITSSQPVLRPSFTASNGQSALSITTTSQSAVVCGCVASVSSSVSPAAVATVVGTRRLRSSSSVGRCRNIVTAEGEECVIPYEPRNFPLDDQEYLLMVKENECQVSPPRPSATPFLLLPTTEASIASVGSSAKEDLTSTAGMGLSCQSSPAEPQEDVHPLDRETQDGRLSPVSELTDSAPEDDTQYDDSVKPEWIISGMQDESGHYVLQVERNQC